MEQLAAPVITFDEASHTYTLDGRPVPSVSKVLEPTYDFRFVNAEALERSRDMGTKVHKTVELFEQGTLVERTLHQTLSRHLDQYKRFKDDFNYISAGQEVIVGSRRYWYCGMLDNHGFLMPKGTDLEEELLLDVKTGDEYPGHKLQTMGYKLAAVEMGVLTKAAKRCSLYLSEDEYRVRWHTSAYDEPAFCALRTFAHWSEHHGK